MGGAAAEGVIDGKIVGFGEIPGVFQEAVGIAEIGGGVDVSGEGLGEDLEAHAGIAVFEGAAIVASPMSQTESLAGTSML